MEQTLKMILVELADFMTENELTFVATAGEENKICISHYNGVSFNQIQFDEEINALDLCNKVKEK